MFWPRLFALLWTLKQLVLLPEYVSFQNLEKLEEYQHTVVTFQTAECFQQAADRSPKSDLSKALRFLEASSSLLHDIISNIHHHFHPDAGPNYREKIHYWRLAHRCYTYGLNYKNSRASTAAYWAETLIFGGPVLFCRGKDEQQVCVKDSNALSKALIVAPV